MYYEKLSNEKQAKNRAFRKLSGVFLFYAPLAQKAIPFFLIFRFFDDDSFFVTFVYLV